MRESAWDSFNNNRFVKDVAMVEVSPAAGEYCTKVAGDLPKGSDKCRERPMGAVQARHEVIVPWIRHQLMLNYAQCLELAA